MEYEYDVPEFPESEDEYGQGADFPSEDIENEDTPYGDESPLKETDDFLEDPVTEEEAESFKKLSYENRPQEDDFEPEGKYTLYRDLESYIDLHPSEEKLKNIEAMYNTGTEEEREEALKQMYGILFYYIWGYLSGGFYSYMSKHADDLFSAALLGVMDGMKNYKASRGAPTTWFLNPIRHQVLTYINTYICHTTAHFTSAERTIKELVRDKEKKGIKCTVRDLYLETGIPVKTIEAALSIGNVSVSSLSAGEKDFDAADLSTDPAKKAMQDEREEALRRAVFEGGLTQDEQFVLCHKEGLFGAAPMGNDAIGRELHGKKDITALYISALEKVKKNVKGERTFKRAEKKKDDTVPEKKYIAKGVMLSAEELKEEEMLLLEEEVID